MKSFGATHTYLGFQLSGHWARSTDLNFSETIEGNPSPLLLDSIWFICPTFCKSFTSRETFGQHYNFGKEIINFDVIQQDENLENDINFVMKANSSSHNKYRNLNREVMTGLAALPANSQVIIYSKV